MRIIILFLLSNFLFAQKNDTINLNLVEVTNYSKYKKFRPNFRKIEQLKDHTNRGLTLLSTFQLPKEGEIEIYAIEILFESKELSKNLCNEFYYFSPIITKSVTDKENLLEEKWFVVDKNYNGKYIFPVHLKIDTREAKHYLIGFKSSYENQFCSEENGYFDLIETTKKSDVYLHFNQEKSSFRKQQLFGNYSLNYIIYYQKK